MPPKLMIPGPVELEAAVLAVMAGPVQAHYGDAWVEAHNETIVLLQQIYKTTGKVFMMPGSGSLALDAAAHSAFAPGDTVIVGNNGWFGQRTTEVMQSNGVRIIPVNADPRQPLDPQDFKRALEAHPDTSGVAFVHLETSTGVLNPVREIAEIVRSHGNALLMVDAVTGLGGSELQTDAWGIDLCVSASQKALGGPAGLAMVAVSERGWSQITQKAGAERSWYLDLRRWQWFVENWGDWHPFPVTMPTAVVLGLREALRSLMREGLPVRMARYERMAGKLRSGLQAMGMELFVPETLMAPILTAAFCPEDVTSTEIKNYLIREHNIQITGGFAAFKEQVIRIGHMGGAITEADIDSLLEALRQFMSVHVS